MKTRNKIFIILSLLIFTNLVFSQQKTIYEKKVNVITLQFINELGLKNLAAKYEKTGDLGSLMALSEFSYRLNTERGFLALLKYKEALKKAESLKNPEEIRKDKIKKESEEKKLKEVELKEAKIKEENLKKKAFLNSDDYNMRQQIKEQFENWLEQSEFEKNDTFNYRIKNKSARAFDSICYKLIENRIYYKDNLKPIITFAKYNAEQEYFNLTIEIQNKKFIDSIKVPINEAENIKNYSEVSINDFEENDWCLIDNEIYPKIVLLKNDNKIIKKINLKNEQQTPLNYSTKSLNINEKLIGQELEFNFAKFNKEIKEEKIAQSIKDSIQGDMNVYNSAGIEVRPQFQKGIEEFLKYVTSKFNEDEKNISIGKKIFTSFIVEKDGTLSEIKILKGINDEIDKKIIGTLTESPKWKSGEQNGKKVRVSMYLPINLN